MTAVPVTGHPAPGRPAPGFSATGFSATGFTGTWALTRLALRQDRTRLAMWLLGLTAVTAASASSLTGLYPTAQERLGYARTNASSAVARVFNGPIMEPGIGAIVMVETLTILAVLATLMNAFTVVRHTRRNEEAGRSELVGSTAVGRHAGLTSALIIAVGSDVVLAGLLGTALISNGLPVSGALAAGTAVAATGIVFACVAAVTAQVAEGARGANGLAAVALGLAFILRAAGDGLGAAEPNGVRVTSAWPSWLSPIGWAQQVRPFAGEAWWVLSLHAVFALALVGLAAVLTAHRDVGAGMMPVRRGPATAARSLLSPLGLAWRLQRGVLFGWAAGMAIMGLALGAVGNEADEMLGTSDQITEAFQRLGGTGSLADVYFSAMMSLFAVVIGCYTVQALLRMRTEETGPLESVLAAGVGRTRWMASHLCCAVAGTVALLALTGLSTGAAYAAVGGPVAEIPRLLGAALVQLPAALVLAGLVVTVLGLAPRLAVATAWGALAVCLLIGQIGTMLDLPQAALNLSPFSHVPAAPAEAVTATPIVLLLVASAALLAIGLGFFHRRDLQC